MEVAYLVEEQRTAIRIFPNALSFAIGSRERPFLVSEQFGCGKLL